MDTEEYNGRQKIQILLREVQTSFYWPEGVKSKTLLISVKSKRHWDFLSYR